MWNVSMDDVSESMDDVSESEETSDSLEGSAMQLHLHDGDLEGALALLDELPEPRRSALRAQHRYYSGDLRGSAPLLSAVCAEPPTPATIDCFASLVAVLGMQGRRGEAGTLFQRGVRAQLSMRTLDSQPFVELGAGIVLAELLGGRPRRAGLILTAGEAMLRGKRVDATKDASLMSLGTTMIDVANGRWSDARRRLDAIAAELEAAGPTEEAAPTDATAHVAAYLALVAAVQGDVSVSLIAREDARTAMLTGNRSLEAHIRYLCTLASLWVRLDDVARHDADELRVYSIRHDLPLMELHAIHLLSLCGGRDAALLERAEVLARRCDAAVAEALVDQIEVGRTTFGVRELARHGVWVPPHPSTLDELSAREREIANYTALGFSASDAAKRLFISRRTVESHLRNIFAKLGVTSRDELADVLHDLRY
jgi:DNA-binding CsgD family transcriptional regulator